MKNGRYSDTIDTSSKNGRFFGFERSWHFLTRKVSWVPPSPFLFLFEMLLLFASLHFALPPRQDAGHSPFRSRKMNTPSFQSHGKLIQDKCRVCSGFDIHKHIYIYYHLHIPRYKKSQEGRLIPSTSSPRNPGKRNPEPPPTKKRKTTQMRVLLKSCTNQKSLTLDSIVGNEWISGDLWLISRYTRMKQWCNKKKWLKFFMSWKKMIV